MISLRDIQSFFKGAIRLSEPLARYTALGIGGPADYYFEPATSKELAHLLDYLQERCFPCVIIHSNMLVSERGFRGAAIYLGSDESDLTPRRKGIALFRQPFNASAAEVIQEADLQGYRSGGAYLAPEDANVVMNDGRATTEDVLAVIRHVQMEVWRRKNIALETDIQLVGFDHPALAKVA